jgi:hypothetical protein
MTLINVMNDDAFREVNDYSTLREVDLWDNLNGTLGSTCILTMANVELNAYYTANGCAARKMRPTPGLSFNYRTPFDDYRVARSFFNKLSLSQPPPANVRESTQTQDLIRLNAWEADLTNS